jgi:hypothetical protein
VVDSASHLAYRISQRKMSRHIAADQAQKPQASTVDATYRFSYASFDGRAVPSRLDLEVGGKPTLSVTATYRRETKHVVFDTRSIWYSTQQGDSASLAMAYGSYDFSNASRPKADPAAGTKRYTRDIESAARLSAKAAEGLKRGRIDVTIRHLRRIVDDYPHTPQAAEARRLLSSLPTGL